MVLDNLGGSLKDTLSKIRNSLTVDRNLVEEILKEIQKALLSSDVNVRLVLEVTKRIRERAINERNENLTKKEQLITIIYEELSAFLGDGKEFELREKQNRILLVGLYGQGKTTTSGKLGNYFKNRTKKVALISTDTWRPAAYDQLKQLGDKIEIQVFGDKTAKKPEEIYKKFKKELDKFEIVIIDSAGRDSLNKELVDEITDLNKIVDPTDTFLVMGADVGQTAQRQAEAFKDNLNVTGVIITKMDGTGKGGGALSACSIVEAPVRFIGVGEKTEDFERFNSEKFVSQLLGMGDIDTLLEKAKLAIDEDKARGMADRMMKGNFDLDDLYEQMGAMKKMGSMSKIMGMMPGMGGLKIDKSQMENQESKMKKWKFIMDSMTKYEKRNPEVIELSRIKRIAQGSGTQVSDLRELLKHFKQTKKMMTMLKDPGSMPDMDNMNPQEIMKMMKKSGMKDFKKLGKKK
ncbi:MAG: signal recognition particle receptor subunit alpha [Candidatus Woesearchaeota archaeon]|jgi:signal recognition particle subunit SRP54|nr:signal recognition particle receptor subunit alpha [Candidatus Woesearchaeota archaeon]